MLIDTPEGRTLLNEVAYAIVRQEAPDEFGGLRAGVGKAPPIAGLDDVGDGLDIPFIEDGPLRVGFGAYRLSAQDR